MNINDRFDNVILENKFKNVNLFKLSIIIQHDTKKLM